MKTNDECIRGFNGLAEYLGVSVAKARFLKFSGKLDGTYFQDARTIIFSRERLNKKLFGN